MTFDDVNTYYGSYANYIVENVIYKNLFFITETNNSPQYATITTDRKINNLKEVSVGWTGYGDKVTFSIRISKDGLDWNKVGDNFSTPSSGSSTNGTLTRSVDTIGDYYVRIFAKSDAKNNYKAGISSIKFTCAENNQSYFDYSTDCSVSEEVKIPIAEWYIDKMLFETTFVLTDLSVLLDGEKIDEQIHIVRKTYSDNYNLYELSGIKFSQAAGQTLKLMMTTLSDKMYVSNIQIPYFITENPCVVPTEGDVVVRDKGMLNITQNTALGTLIIYPSGEVTIPEGVSLTTDSLVLFGGIDEVCGEERKYSVPQLVLAGTLNNTASSLLYRMRVDAEQMYTVAFPYSVQVADIVRSDGLSILDEEGQWTGNLWMETYDGAHRAKGGRREDIENNSWKQDAAIGSTLQAGIGYTIAAPRLRGSSNYPYSLIDFPMGVTYPIIAERHKSKGEVEVLAYTNKETNTTDWGWNLLANPYMSAVNGEQYELKVNNTRYDVVTMLTDDGEGYYQFVYDDEESILPFKHFFLQIGTDGTFWFCPRLTPSAPRYLCNVEKEDVTFSLVLSNDGALDRTYVLLSPQFTEEYEIGFDVVKMCSAETQVYSISDGAELFRMAAHIEENKLIPLGYKVPTSGEYKLAIQTKEALTNVEHVYLLEKGIVVADLKQENYLFESLAGITNDRFTVQIVQPGMQTMNTNINATDSWGMPKKIIRNSFMYIVLPNGHTYDFSGLFMLSR